MIKKLFAILLAAAMLGGCAEAVAVDTSSSESSSASVEESSKPGKENAEGRKTANMVFGKVTGIDGNTITLLTVKAGPGQRPDREAGPRNRQRGPSDASEPVDSQSSEAEGSAADQPDEKSNGRPSRGQPPVRDTQKEFSGEEKTITVADGCSILIEKDGESSEGSLSDIKADDTISVEFAEDGETPVTITVRTGGLRKQGNRPNDTDNAASQSADSSSNNLS
ncbi:MAG: hypothetical protein E7476_00335 [Ruminococcaceae bacterium]|nr:hypothetical protein [Oscillospiraceae bacterium]